MPESMMGYGSYSVMCIVALMKQDLIFQDFSTFFLSSMMLALIEMNISLSRFDSYKLS